MIAFYSIQVKAWLEPPAKWSPEGWGEACIPQHIQDILQVCEVLHSPVMLYITAQLSKELSMKLAVVTIIL